MGWWGGSGRAAAAALRRLRGARYSLGRAPVSPPPPPLGAADLERADAWLLRKALEGGLLSWFRNGLLSTGIGVISYVQSDTGRDAAYGFFLLGGLCVCYGGGSYLLSLALLRRPLLLGAPTAAAAAAPAALLPPLWLGALSLYLGRLEVEVGPEEPPQK
ncbi:transmembrane protein 160 [Podargus strigoides]